MKGLLGALYGDPFASAGFGLLSSNYPSAVPQNPYHAIRDNLLIGQQLKQKAITEKRESTRWDWEEAAQLEKQRQRAAVSAYFTGLQEGNQPQVYATVEQQPQVDATVEEQPDPLLPPVNVDEYDRPPQAADLYTEDFPLLATPADRAVFVDAPEVDATTVPQALAWGNVDEYGRPLVDAPVPQVDATVEDQLLSAQPSTQLLDSRVPTIDSSVLTKYKEAVDRGPGQQTAQPTSAFVSELNKEIQKYNYKIDNFPYENTVKGIESFEADKNIRLDLLKQKRELGQQDAYIVDGNVEWLTPDEVSQTQQYHRVTPYDPSSQPYSESLMEQKRELAGMKSPAIGSPDWEKRILNRNKQRITLTTFIEDSSVATRRIDRIIEAFTTDKWLSAGTGELPALLPKSPQRTILNDLKTLKNVIGFDALKELRANSVSGASGLGQLSNRELDVLQNLLGELDPKDPVGLVKNLNRIKNRIENMQAKLISAYNEDYSELGDKFLRRGYTATDRFGNKLIFNGREWVKLK